MTIAVPLPTAAVELGVSARWLMEWLREHPCDAMGIPFYRRAGRAKLFTEDAIYRIRATLPWPAFAPTHRGRIYFIEGADCIKIGYSHSLESRIVKMRTDCPVQLKLLHIEPGTFKTETALHRRFAALRVRGEWFRKGDELLAYIDQRIAACRGKQ